MRALIVGVCSAVAGPTEIISAETRRSVANARAITGKATRSAMSWGVQHSRDYSAATCWRSGPIATEIILLPAAGARQRAKPPMRLRRAER